MDLRLLSPEQFELLCARLLQAERFKLLKPSGKSHDIGIDFLVATDKHEVWAVEVKHRQRPAFGSSDLRMVVNQVVNAKQYLDADAALIMISTPVTVAAREIVSLSDELTLWDESDIQRLLEKHVDIQEEFTLLLGTDQSIRKRLLEATTQEPRASELLDRLENLKKGEDSWRDFEELCIEILNYAFIPPLHTPKIQSRSEDGLDRRDAIYAIGYGHTFWDNLKSECRTRFVVAEFKNYTDAPTQTEIESIQQYLFTKAMRSFGILCCRVSPSPSALKARRRAWTEFDKLVVILSDEELKEILQMRAGGEDPTVVIDSQLNDFFAALSP